MPICVVCTYEAQQGEEREWDILEMKLQSVMRYQVGAGNQTGVRIASVLNC